MNIAATGTEQWEILSDDLVQAFEEMADRTAAHWEEITDGLAIQEGVLPTPPRTPWPSLEAAMRESEYVALLAVAITPSERYAARPDDVTSTVRPVARAS